MLKAVTNLVNVSQITGVLPVVNGGTGVTTSTGTGNTVLSAAPTLSGNVTLSTGNLIVASGQGIDFSATSSGSGTMTSELLADYEEGTFTPTATQSTSAPTLTYTGRSGKYVKIGRVVVAHLEIIIGAVSAPGVGATQITGLPFIISEDNYGGQGSFGYNDALVNTVYGCWCTGTTVLFRAGARGSGNDTGGWSAGGYLDLTIVYQV
jgi:hypothetical protein